MNLFAADSITMQFAFRKVLSGAQIEARSGDVVGILGLNGTGKSTLYKCLLGLYRESTGTVHLDGEYIARGKRLSCFGYLSQDSFLPKDYPVWKSVALILRQEKQAQLLTSDSRAKGLLQRRCGSLSLGERRYLECLIVLSLDRPVVLLDEPFSQLEPIYCERLSQIIKETVSCRAILLSDHFYRNVQRTCNQIRVLSKGILWTVENSERSLQEFGYLLRAT